jgi:hypothetical protein
MPILLRELFNTVYPWTRSDYADGRLYRFTTINGDHYEVDFENRIMNDFLGDMDKEEEEDLRIEAGIDPEDPVVEVAFGKLSSIRGLRNYKIVSSEDYIGVFSTVLDIMRKEIRPTQAIMFSAKEPSRIKLYDRMVKKFKRPRDIGYKFGDSYNVFYILIPK